jgi:HPt (histidine-containing phosphotransfer) domain-containing protein
MIETPEQRAAAARVRMAELAVKFLERTGGEIGLMRARLAAFGNGERAALGEIRNLAHRICGTGATLGFEALAEQAHRVEKLAAAQSPEEPATAATLAAFTREIEVLAGEAARTRPRDA